MREAAAGATSDRVSPSTLNEGHGIRWPCPIFEFPRGRGSAGPDASKTRSVIRRLVSSGSRPAVAPDPIRARTGRRPVRRILPAPVPDQPADQDHPRAVADVEHHRHARMRSRRSHGIIMPRQQAGHGQRHSQGPARSAAKHGPHLA